jgi:hypothetical protein
VPKQPFEERRALVAVSIRITDPTTYGTGRLIEVEKKATVEASEGEIDAKISDLVAEIEADAKRQTGEIDYPDPEPMTVTSPPDPAEEEVGDR